jgi:hypothetical protein
VNHGQQRAKQKHLSESGERDASITPDWVFGMYSHLALVGLAMARCARRAA